MSETYFWVAALLDQVLNLDLRPNFKIARVLRVPSPKIFDTVPPPDHSRVSGSLREPRGSKARDGKRFREPYID